MITTDSEIKLKGLQILTQYLGDVEAERFLALMQREPFDYTLWRQDLAVGASVEQLSSEAMAWRTRNR